MRLLGALVLWAFLVGTGRIAIDREAQVRVPLAIRIPPRPAGAAGGSEIARRVRDLDGVIRDTVVLEELLRGNVPDFLRALEPVHLWGADRSGRIHRGVVWVTADYVAVGSNQDFVRVPLGLEAASTLARSIGCTLPTTKIVDRIHEQAKLRLTPQPMPSGPRMRSTDYILRHHWAIERQRGVRSTGELVSGHKKDLVLSSRLLRRREKLAIYGWHHRDGLPIQSLSTFHGRRYADYSHGVRLVAVTMLLDAKPWSLFDVLRDPDLASVLSDEGPIEDGERILRR